MSSQPAAHHRPPGKARNPHPAPHDFLGYPDSWAAGPWSVPMFWLSVAICTWMLVALA